MAVASLFSITGPTDITDGVDGGTRQNGISQYVWHMYCIVSKIQSIQVYFLRQTHVYLDFDVSNGSAFVLY